MELIYIIFGMFSEGRLIGIYEFLEYFVVTARLEFQYIAELFAQGFFSILASFASIFNAKFLVSVFAIVCSIFVSKRAFNWFKTLAK